MEEIPPDNWQNTLFAGLTLMYIPADDLIIWMKPGIFCPLSQKGTRWEVAKQIHNFCFSFALSVDLKLLTNSHVSDVMIVLGFCRCFTCWKKPPACSRILRVLKILKFFIELTCLSASEDCLLFVPIVKSYQVKLCDRYLQKKIFASHNCFDKVFQYLLVKTAIKKLTVSLPLLS